MTEKEKMLLQEIYDANNDKELISERQAAKSICYEYNNLNPNEIEKRIILLKKLLGKTKEKLHIEQPFMCDYGYNIEIGDNFYANHNLIILDAAKVTIGNNVFIAPNCGIYTAHHPIDVLQRNEGLEYASNVVIGNNVWIGGNVTILPGVKIGDNCTIGAGSVVTKDIPANSVAYGNPCKVAKKI